MTRAFWGKGWHFPVAQGDHGDIVKAEHEERIHQSLWLILSTAKGERVMRPDFGCDLHRYLFAVSNAATAARVREAVREAVILYEPRVALLDVRVAPAPGEPHVLLIHLEYRIRTTNNHFNLVYPFYLERG